MKVTGSGRGIGRATALAFAQAGAKVMITARTENDINHTAEERKKLGNKVGTRLADGMKLSDLEKLVTEGPPTPTCDKQETEKQLGPVDILMCNAYIPPSKTSNP